MKLTMKKMVLSLALGGVLGSAWAAPAYLRFPSVRGDQLVFTAEGDLWKTNLQGGQAQRLTTHPAAETQSAISFDKSGGLRRRL
jgi:tricorn protease